MGLKVDYITYQNECRPILTWNHNMEPDMLRYDHGDTKKYEIWKASEPNMNTVPHNYNLLNVVERHESETPYYIDLSTIGFPCYDGPLGNAITYPVRYKIKAVDNGYVAGIEKKSVLSNFAMAFGVVHGSGIPDEDGPISNNKLPNDYKLFQNYPNPFNPKTNIIYHLPKECFVNIKVYDIIGKEIAVLVNEFKVGGSHIVSFNGSKLSSGVYFYKIEAGTFTDIKRMVLIK